MTKKQRQILINFAVVITITIAAVLGMIEIKNQVNQSEAMRAMEQLGQIVSEYKQQKGSIPSESYALSIKDSLEGKVRLGNLQYRARWINFDSPPDTILAYVQKSYHSLFFRPGAIVLRLDGKVEWLDIDEFKQQLTAQQSIPERESMRK